MGIKKQIKWHHRKQSVKFRMEVMLQDNLFFSQINDMTERKNLKNRNQPNARFVSLVWILVLTLKGFFFKTEEVFTWTKLSQHFLLIFQV